MAKNDFLNNQLVARGQWKCIVAASSSGTVGPPSGVLLGSPYQDGVLTVNGSGANANRRLFKMTVAAGGTVTIYDANAVGSIGAANKVWTRMVTTADLPYDFDVPFAAGIYIVTDANAQVVVVFD